MTAIPVKEMSEEARLQYHQEAEARSERFKFEPPPPINRPKQVKFLLDTGLLKIAMQVVRDGGENNLHYHTAMDEAWYVVQGRARFYGPDGHFFGELGPTEGLSVPAGARYRFEKTGDEELHIMQVIAVDKSAPEKSMRYNVEETKSWMKEEIFKHDDPSMASRGA